jgi:hypothetical protein
MIDWLDVKRSIESPNEVTSLIPNEVQFIALVMATKGAQIMLNEIQESLSGTHTTVAKLLIAANALPAGYLIMSNDIRTSKKQIISILELMKAKFGANTPYELTSEGYSLGNEIAAIGSNISETGYEAAVKVLK